MNPWSFPETEVHPKGNMIFMIDHIRPLPQHGQIASSRTPASAIYSRFFSSLFRCLERLAEKQSSLTYKQILFIASTVRDGETRHLGERGENTLSLREADSKVKRNALRTNR